MTASSLADELEAARAAPASSRIDHRDRIAAYGSDAIDAMTQWLTSPVLSWFAVRVIGRAGQLGDQARAIQVLRDAFDDPSVACDRDDVAAQLRLLGAVVSAPPPRPPSEWPASIPATAGTGWPGFRAHEFITIAGTSWRGRTGRDSLIPHLVRPLRDLDPRFESWSISRLQEVHIAVQGRYRDREDKWQGHRAAKLVTYAHVRPSGSPEGEPVVTVGLLVEKGDGQEGPGEIDSRWDWPYFVARLRDDSFRTSLTDVMTRHDLWLGDYVGGSFVAGNGDMGFTGHIEASELIIDAQPSGRERGWQRLVDRLEALPESKWHNLHIWRSWPAEEATAAGPSFAGDAMMPVLTDLARIYLRFVGPV